MSLDFFQWSSGLIQVVVNSIALSAAALAAPSVEQWHSVVVVFRQCRTREKPSTLHYPPTELEPRQRPRPSLARGSVASRFPKWESFKVIALDKFHVNTPYFLRQLKSSNHHSSLSLPPFLLQQVNVSPYLRLAE